MVRFTLVAAPVVLSASMPLAALSASFRLTQITAGNFCVRASPGAALLTAFHRYGGNHAQDASSVFQPLILPCQTDGGGDGLGEAAAAAQLTDTDAAHYR